MSTGNAARLALVATSLLLGGCETLGSIDFNPPPPPPPDCPRAVVAEGAGRLTRFAGGGTDPANISFEAEILEITGTCGEDDGVLDVEMEVQIAARRGPAAAGDVAAFNYFVAVARADKTILARQAFDASIELPEDGSGSGIVEEIEQTISIGEDDSGANYVIIVGFEMTPEELEYSRQQDR